MSKAKHYCFTLNNPTEDEIRESLSSLPGQALYLCYGREVGEGGTPHLQGYISWKNRRSLRQCKQWLFRAHFLVCKGTPQENINYCGKDCTEENPLVEFGEAPAPKGSRTDLKLIQVALDAGETIEHVADEHFAQWVQYRRSFEAYITLKNPERLRPDLQVIVLHGDTGVGKTRFASEYAEAKGGAWISSDPKLQWFDGYNNQHVSIIDDFDGECGFRWLLRLLDIYKLRVPIKGGFVAWNPDIIFITTNTDPESWYPGLDVSPLRRRIRFERIRGMMEGMEWPDYYDQLINKFGLQ